MPPFAIPQEPEWLGHFLTICIIGLGAVEV